MSRRKPGRTALSGGTGADSPPTGPLQAVLFCVFGLLLLTPFIVDGSTVFPFVVGKALWSRSLIEVAFALWAVLALRDPAYLSTRKAAALGLMGRLLLIE